jgi:hypothetical protein
LSNLVVATFSIKNYTIGKEKLYLVGVFYSGLNEVDLIGPLGAVCPPPSLSILSMF